MSHEVVIIGSGFAGCSAAARLAGDGYAPLLLERTPCLGGRAASFRNSATGEVVDYGQHVLMRCCTAALGFLQRIDATATIRLQPKLAIPIVYQGRMTVLGSAWLPGLLHLAPSLLTYAPLAFRERLAVIRAALPLLIGDKRTDEAFGSWLYRHGQSRKAIERLWNPICMATLNASVESVSLGAACQVFREGFFRPGGADMGLFTVPLSEVFEAARNYIEARGGEVRTSMAVATLHVEAGRVVGVELVNGQIIETGAVIAAVPPDALQALLTEVDSSNMLGGADDLTWSPIVNLHLWFDRPVMETEFVIPIDSPIQTIFDITRLHGPERRGDGASHIVISQSAAYEWIGLPSDQIADDLLNVLPAVLPDVSRAVCLRRLVIKHPRATLVDSPGSGRLRPSSKTWIAGLYLAGDWTATGWPSTIEGAVRSGVTAAARCQQIISSLVQD